MQPASVEPTQSIVSAQWLSEHLSDPDVLIVDCRFALSDPEAGQAQYWTSHIPGAYFLDLNRDLSGPVGQHGGRHPLPDPEQLAAKLRSIGLSSHQLVVAYDDSRFAFAARLWWLLRYLGHERVAVLDGGWQRYCEAGYPVTAVQPSASTVGDFQPQIRPEMVVQWQQVKHAQTAAGVVLVDAREPQRYRGEVEPIDPIAGHIPGAVNYPWQAVTDTQGQLRSRADLQAHWAEIGSAQEVIIYCGSGVTACVNLLSLAAIGLTSAKLYPGSWSDWCSYQVENSDLNQA